MESFQIGDNALIVQGVYEGTTAKVVNVSSESPKQVTVYITALDQKLELPFDAVIVEGRSTENDDALPKREEMIDHSVDEKKESEINEEWFWQLQISDTYDVWYYNVKTDVSAWDPPGLSTPETTETPPDRVAAVDAAWQTYLNAKFDQQKAFLFELQRSRQKIREELLSKFSSIDDEGKLRKDPRCLVLFKGKKKLTSALCVLRDMLIFVKSCKSYSPGTLQWKDENYVEYDESSESYQEENLTAAEKTEGREQLNKTIEEKEQVISDSPDTNVNLKSRRKVEFSTVVTQKHTSGEESCSPLHSPVNMSPTESIPTSFRSGIKVRRKGPRHLSSAEKIELYKSREDLKQEEDLAECEKARKALGGAVGAAADASSDDNISTADLTTNRKNTENKEGNTIDSKSDDDTSISEGKQTSQEENGRQHANRYSRKRKKKRTSPPRIKDIGRWTHVLFSACERGNSDMIEKLFNDGCPVDLRDPQTGDTALLRSCRAGKADIVKLCLSYGANLDPHPEFGLTALQVTVEANHYDCLIVVLDAIASEARQNSHTDSMRKNTNNRSLFASDAQESNNAVLYDEEREKKAVKEALEVAVNQEASIHGVGGFPVHIAARNGSVQCLEELLRHNANPELLDAAMRTPAHIAASTGHFECLQLLLQTLESSDVLLEAIDHEGCTALHCAAHAGHEKCVRLLLETAANPLRRDARGRQPKDLAKAAGHASCLALLLEYGDDRTSENETEGDSAEKKDKFHKTSSSDQVKVEKKVVEEPSKFQIKRANSAPATALKKTKAIAEAKSPEELCVICRDQPKDTALLPCGHKCVCFSCGNMMLFRSTCLSPKSNKPRCPICRSNIQTVARIYG